MDVLTLVFWLIGFVYFLIQLMRKIEPAQRRPWTAIFWISIGGALFWPVIFLIACVDYLHILWTKRKQ